MDGYIKLWRKSIDSIVFQNANLWKVWCYCLMRANHKETKILFNDEEITLMPGQFVTGREKGAKDCNMNPSTFRDQILKLKKLKNLDSISDNKKSIITIVNWAYYQGNEIYPDSKPDNNPTTTRHRQECKNDKKNNIYVQNSFFNPDTDEKFNKFWNLYDKKVAKDKVLKLWSKLKPDEIDKIFLTLPDYINATPDKQFRKNPDTYLRNKCWNDEIVKNNNPEHINSKNYKTSDDIWIAK